MGPAARRTGCEAETSGNGQSQGEGSLEAGEWVPCAEPDWSEAEEAGSCRGVAVRQGDGCTQAGAQRAVQQAILWQEGLPVPKAATSTCCLKQAHAAQRLHSSALTSDSCSLREGIHSLQCKLSRNHACWCCWISKAIQKSRRRRRGLCLQAAVPTSASAAAAACQRKSLDHPDTHSAGSHTRRTVQ